MINDAFHALDAIKSGRAADLNGQTDWIEAFKTMRWAVETIEGPALTDAGEKALAEMRRDRGRAG
jgi:hypothetical protein